VIRSNQNINNAIKLIQKIIENKYIVENNLYHDVFEKIIERLEDKTFKLAVVGEFSSGKSTFLNALIGKDILKHGAQETTATITEIKNEKLKDDKIIFDVLYSNGVVEENIDIEKLKDYTTTSSTVHSVAENISKVTIKNHFLDYEGELSVIDTPGLNGIADKHREKTEEQIKNSHACIYLMSVRGLGESDIRFLKYISEYQKNIIFVQNFIDELKELEGETPEGKITEQKKIISEKLFDENSDVNYEITGISAYQALISRDVEMSEGKNLSQSQQEELYKRSNFDTVLNKILELMKKNEREKIQQKDAINVAIYHLKRLNDIYAVRNEFEKKEWELTPEARKTKGYEKIIKTLQQNKEKNLENVKNFIEANANDIRRKINRKIEEDLRKVEEEIVEILRNEANNVKNMEKYINEFLKSDIHRKVEDIKISNNNFLNVNFDNLLSDALLVVQDYIGITSQNSQNIFSFNTEIKVEMRNFQKDEDNIEKYKKDILLEKARLEQKKREKFIAKNNITEFVSQLNYAEQTKKQNIQNKNNKIIDLGNKPDAETKYRTEIHTEKHLLSWFVGDKTVTSEVPYKDYSKQREWERKRSEIENEFAEKDSKLRTQINYLQSKCDEFRSSIQNIENLEVRKQKEIQEMEKLLNSKKIFLQEAKEKATLEYIGKVIKDIKLQLNNYLFNQDNNIKDIFIDNFEQLNNQNKTKVTRTVTKLYDISFDQRIRFLKNLLNDSSENNKTLKTDEIILEINQTINELEEIVCQI
jgi:predicted GTPases (dynamin-related)